MPEILRVGSTGNSVSRLQKALVAMGFNPGKTKGTFDTETQISIKHFQEGANLEVNGEVDEKVWDSIMEITWKGTSEPVTLHSNPASPYQRHLMSDVELNP